MIDPALGTLGIAYPPPVLELRSDFDRQAGAGIDPGDVIVLGRTDADVHAIGFQADIARNGQSTRRDGGILRRKPCRDRSPQATTHEDRDQTETPQRHFHSSPAEISPTQFLRAELPEICASSLDIRALGSLMQAGPVAGSCLGPTFC